MAVVDDQALRAQTQLAMLQGSFKRVFPVVADNSFARLIRALDESEAKQNR